MDKIDKVLSGFMIFLMIISVIFSYFSWDSSKDLQKTMDKSANDSEKTLEELTRFNEKINDTNQQIKETNFLLNLTKTQIENLKLEKPNIQITQSSRQEIHTGSEIKQYCDIILNCSENLISPINESKKYSLTYLKVENQGIRANNVKVNIYYGSVEGETKEIILVGKAKEFIGDEFDISFNPIGKVVTLEIPELDLLSKINLWVFIEEGDAQGNMINIPVQFSSDEIALGEGILAL